MKTKIQKQLAVLEPQILELENAISANYCYNFEWGYANDLYLLKVKKFIFLEILKDLESGHPDVTVIEYYINLYTNEILDGRFLANSSNRASNEAGLLRKEAKVEIINFLKRL
jgi:hypothetical protein